MKKNTIEILIVEDDPDVVDFTRVLLSDFIDGKINSVRSGEEAIVYVKEHAPDIILMDIILAGALDGIETAKRIHAFSDVPIIFTTGHNDDLFLKRAKITNPFGYLTKPIQERDLQAVITIAMQQYEQNKLLLRENYITKSLKRIYHPLFITDKNGFITAINDAARKLFGVEEQAILHKHISEYLKVTINTRTLHFEDEIAKAEQNKGLYKEENMVTLLLPNGSVLPISLTFSLIYTDRGELDGVSVMLVDLTQQTLEKNILHKKQLEAAELLIRERKLKNILDIGKDINQELLHMTPIEQRLENVLNIMATFPTFKLAHITLKKGDKLAMRAVSRNASLYLNYTDILPETDEDLTHFYKAFHQQQIELIDQPAFSIYNERIAVLKLTSMMLLPLKNVHTKEPLGVLCITSDSEEAFDIDIINYFEEFASDISLAITLQNHRDELMRLKNEKEKNYEQTILSFVQMIEERDSYTKGHSVHVGTYAKMLGEAMGLTEKECDDLYTAGILHDIGKIQTPDNVLLKPGKLEEDEFDLVKEHVTAGVRMLEHIDTYKDLLHIINEHHERYDGTGYPQGLKEDAISLQGKILALADAFDAMTTNRVYHQGLNVPEALQELEKHSGTQFDPAVVNTAKNIFATLKLENTTEQFLESKFLHERMAYYFRDPLTNMFNEEYFKHFVDVKENMRQKYICVYRISGLDAYNEQQGWCAGNEIIKRSAQLLKKEFQGIASEFFRLHGNKFVIVSDKQIDIDEHIAAFNELNHQYGLNASIQCYDETIFDADAPHERNKTLHKLIC